MTKPKHLSGKDLDALVANLEGVEPGLKYSTDWSAGGPIIDKYNIELLYFGSYGGWEAQIGKDAHYIDQYPGDATPGETPLIASMRAYVKWRLKNANI